MHRHTNKLSSETSPYLLQHAHNPVDWYPWGEEALNRAKQEDKPVLVSIGYAACHWCHVMERESFEDEATAAFMNEHFINIKIDREERPDLDHIYMDAVQAITGQGGWPLNVFLTPAGKPFYGGTYFPPRRAFNRASWLETLEGIVQAYTGRRHEIDAQAESLTEHLEQANSFGLQKEGDPSVFSEARLHDAFGQIMKSADPDWGGFGKAPKFPQTFTIGFLLRYHHVLAEGGQATQALQQALLSLDKMIEGGIYDQLGGGLARYSTDAEWLAPHFEKMLYDNALLLNVLSEAYQLTRKERYREVIAETIGFVQRELLHTLPGSGEKGFYAALDADSEGVEGKFYIWHPLEVKEVLGEDATLFCRYYDITAAGNWHEGKGSSILRVKTPPEQFARENGLEPAALQAMLERGRRQLLERRAGRVRPLLDDKVILAWNALMNTACSKAFAATGNGDYRQLAIDNMTFLLNHFGTGQPQELHHTWKNGEGKYPAFLDDYACLVQALLELHTVTADTRWLLEAQRISEYVITHFSEEGTGFFYYTRAGQPDVIVRKKEVYDGALPSGNSLMAYNLYRLSILLDRRDWRERSEAMVAALGQAIVRYPTSFGVWSCLLLEMVAGTHEIALVGPQAPIVLEELLREFIPHRVTMASFVPDDIFPLLRGKAAAAPVAAYLCKNFTCREPVYSVTGLLELVNGEK
ncbi:MAG: thioredoxin domain-containing protein [Chitinophagaceae bacterium]